MFTTISLNTNNPNIFSFSGNVLTNSQSNILINNFINNRSNISVLNNFVNRNLINTPNIYNRSNIFSGNSIGNLYISERANIYNNLFLNGNISLNNQNVSNIINTFTTNVTNGNIEKLSINGNLSVTNISMNPLFTFNLLPVGSVLLYGGIVVPTGWLLCDGSTFSSATYPSLATLLGSSTLPNLQEDFIRGNFSSTVGTTGGSFTTTLNSTHLPSHNHTTGTLSATHRHNISFPSTNYGVDIFSVGGNQGDGSASTLDNQTATTIGGNSSTENPSVDGTVGNSGSSTSFSILPPYVTVKYIIKAI
jgi:microcystin-dependent protein